MQFRMTAAVAPGSAPRRPAALLSVGAITLVLALSGGAIPATAQQIPGVPQQNVPSGSPVDPGIARRDGTRANEQAEDFEPLTTRRVEAAGVEDNDRSDRDDDRSDRNGDGRSVNTTGVRSPLPAPPNEFERFVAGRVGRPLPRFGSDLLVPDARSFDLPATATVPADYILAPGDTVAIAMTGSIEGSVARTIDTNGRIVLPQVGPIRLAGVRNGDLRDTIAGAIGTRFRGFTVTTSISTLRGIRVYVTGFANAPGAYTVSSLSTLFNAVLAAGGPAAGGSMRSVQLYRNNQLVTDFDLYDILLRGDRGSDAVLQDEDVLFIRPAGGQVAVTGSVNKEAVFELRPGETLEDVLAFAGGPNTVADTSRLIVDRQEAATTVGSVEIARADAATRPAAPGDLIRIVSQGTLLQSIQRQAVAVRIEGEVNRPGVYHVPASTPLARVVEMAGGLTSTAFVYGTIFERASVRVQQRQAFEDALDQLETAVASAPLADDGFTSPTDRAAQAAAARATIARLRAAEPDGRLVFQLPYEAAALPNAFVLENNDRIAIPARPTTIGVFGAVYRPASFVYEPAQARRMTVRDYIARAGGTIRSADRRDMIVVRANGEVLSRANGVTRARLRPGDVVFVPTRTSGASTWAKIRDITTTIFQLGLSAATIAVLTR